MRLLVVEEDAETAHVTSAALRIRGHEVTAVGSGKAALCSAAAQAFDAALVETDLPDLEGFVLVQSLMALQPGLRCILVTSQYMPDGELRARSIGAHFLAKPLDVPALDTFFTSSSA